MTLAKRLINQGMEKGMHKGIPGGCKGSRKNKYPVLLVFLPVFSSCENTRILHMRPLPRLEYEQKFYVLVYYFLRIP